MEDGKYILPTFIIPGAGKSGTSFLAWALSQHHDVFMSYPKEPAFFSTYPEIGFYHKGMDFYQKCFVGYAGQKHICEASTVYMYDPESPRLIAEHIPEAKLIFILRNPIDRVYSNYWHDIKTGRELGDFKELLFNHDKRIDEMIHTSRYDIHLESYFRYFSRGQILILLYDDLRENSLHVINKTLSFLGLEEFPAGTDFNRKINPPSFSYSKRFARIVRNQKLTGFIQGVVPNRVFPPLRRAVAFMIHSLERPFEYPDMDKESRDYLLRLFDKPVSDLSVMIGKDLSSWRELAK